MPPSICGRASCLPGLYLGDESGAWGKDRKTLGHNILESGKTREKLAWPQGALNSLIPLQAGCSGEPATLNPQWGRHMAPNRNSRNLLTLYPKESQVGTHGADTPRREGMGGTGRPQQIQGQQRTGGGWGGGGARGGFKP